MAANSPANLERLASQYESLTGHRPNLFICPMTGNDVNCLDDIINGHVVNQSIPNSSNVTVPQRKDIDSFYGTHFEAAFTGVMLGATTGILPFFERTNSGRPPVILSETGHLSYHLTTKEGRINGKRSFGPEHTPATLVSADGSNRVPIAIHTDKCNSDYLKQCSEITFRHSTDARLETFVSIFKAAYLTMFHLLGYHYVLGEAGTCIGPNLLGASFQNYRNLDRQAIHRCAYTHFDAYGPCVTRMDLPESYTNGCSVDSKRFDVVYTSTDNINFTPVAYLVYIKANATSFGVLLPCGGIPESVDKFIHFRDSVDSYLLLDEIEVGLHMNLRLTGNQRRIKRPTSSHHYLSRDPAIEPEVIDLPRGKLEFEKKESKPESP